MSIRKKSRPCTCRINTNLSVTLQTKWNWARSKKLSCTSSALVMARIMLRSSYRESSSSESDSSSSRQTTSQTTWTKFRAIEDSNKCARITILSSARARLRQEKAAMLQVRATRPSTTTWRPNSSSRSIAATRLGTRALQPQCPIRAS